MDRPALDRDPPGRTEVLVASERTRVTRLFLPGRTVIRKEPLGPDAQRRLQHELAMLERLRGVAGSRSWRTRRGIRARSCWPTPAARAWPGWRSRWPSMTWSGLRWTLARAVAEMHRRGVMHRDITPANIVVSRDGAPCLVDFALATSLAEMRPEFTHHTRDRRDAGVSGAGADRADRPVGGSARRPVRVGRDAVRAGHGRAAVRLRRPAAAHP